MENCMNDKNELVAVSNPFEELNTMSHLIDNFLISIYGSELEGSVKYVLDGNTENLIEFKYNKIFEKSIIEQVLEEFDWLLGIKEISSNKFVFVFERNVLPPYER